MVTIDPLVFGTDVSLISGAVTPWGAVKEVGGVNIIYDREGYYKANTLPCWITDNEGLRTYIFLEKQHVLWD